MVIAYFVVTQRWVRVFVGTVLIAMGVVALLVALAARSSEAGGLALGAAAAVASGVVMLWFTDLFRPEPSPDSD